MKRLFDRIVLMLNGVALILIGIALVDFVLHPWAGDYNFNSPVFRALAILLLTPFTLLVGLLIIRRVPGNIVGPLLIVFSGTVAYGSIREDIGPVLLSVFYYYDLVFGWLALFLMIAHFPNGTLYPPGSSRWIYRLLGFNIFINSFIFLSTDPLQIPSEMSNPFLLPELQEYAQLILVVGLLFFLPILVLALVSPVLRFRKGNPLERQQIKWLALFAGVNAISVLLGLIAYPMLTGGIVMSPGTGAFAVFFYIGNGLLPPAAIGISILRYRLWDIDLIIRRTLVYSILTMILTLVYFGSVAVLHELFQRLTGEGQSPIVTVISTLGIAALFTPLRRYIQERIDRRFYRQKYNAEKVLAAFSASLRERIDVDNLEKSILEVVTETMQPASSTLWVHHSDQQSSEGNFRLKSAPIIS